MLGGHLGFSASRVFLGSELGRGAQRGVWGGGVVCGVEWGTVQPLVGCAEKNGRGEVAGGWAGLGGLVAN